MSPTNEAAFKSAIELDLLARCYAAMDRADRTCDHTSCPWSCWASYPSTGLSHFGTGLVRLVARPF